MRLRHITLAAALCSALTACSGGDTGPGGRSALSETFDTSNYRQSSNTNGTQTRRDVNRQYTAPSLPSIMFRGN